MKPGPERAKANQKFDVSLQIAERIYSNKSLQFTLLLFEVAK
jgi:hypothetical protein